MQLSKSTEFSFVIKSKIVIFPDLSLSYTFVYFTFTICDDCDVFPSFPSFHVEGGGQTLKE